jgi:hypothetical protein
VKACAADALDGLIVVAAQRVPADDGDVLQHSCSVAEVADAGSLVVGPAYRDFDDAVAALVGDEQNLRVKAPALDGLELEDGLRGGAGEGLESALCVGVREPHDGMGDQVETTAEELAVERLSNGLARALEPARADGDVGAAGDGGKKPVGFLDWSREIGIGKHDYLAERVKNAVAHAVTFAAIAGILEHADFGRILGEGTNDFSSVVVRTVVDHDNFGVPAALANAGDDGLKSAADAGGLVICRYDNAVLRVGHLGVVRAEGPTFNVSYAGEPAGDRMRADRLGTPGVPAVSVRSSGGVPYAG